MNGDITDNKMSGTLNASRIIGLDSIRGIAAMIVVFNHFYYVIPNIGPEISWLFMNTPLNMLISGRQAVIIFFVLSGFVLAIPYFKNKQQGYGAYLVRRIFRIYIPFLVTICIAAVLWLFIAEPHPENAPLGGDWSHAVDWKLFFSHLFMTGITDANVLNPPMWTLIIEMRISIMFPLLVLLIQRFSWGGLIISVLAGYMAAKLFVQFDGSRNFYMADTILGSILLTIYYIPYFLFGVVIASRTEFFKTGIRRIPKAVHLLIAPLIITMPYSLLKQHAMIAEYWYAVVAIYVILCCISFERINKLLSVKTLQWLGKVSYSLYLIHLPVILSMIYLLKNDLQIIVILALSFPLILLASEAMNRWVEIPAMKFGKNLMRAKKP